MPDYRIEHDLLGEMQVPADTLYGIHTARAMENFPLARRPVRRELIHAYGQVKLACARTNHELGRWDEPTFAAIAQACGELAEGMLDDHIAIDALQGGAGTSTNMNVNEVIANRALRILGRPLGSYSPLPQVGERLGEGDDSRGAQGGENPPSPQPSPLKEEGACVHPLDDINLHQSTNDTYPTALRVAAIVQLHALEQTVIKLHDAFSAKEKELAHVVRVGRTQLQDAVLTTLGRQMGAYAEALARDRWRLYKCEERLRVVNLGGTAIGTGLGAPRQFIFKAIEHLRDITGLGLARAENMLEATQNTDALVEVSGIVRALASNLLKIANDLRLLSSGPDAGFGEIKLPQRQAGSSIMPGKINPVIPEAVAQAALMVSGYDQTIFHACSGGNLELNHLYPLVADCLLGEIDLMINACDLFARHCVEGIEADEQRCAAYVAGATATVTALVDAIGYEKATEVALAAQKQGKTIREIVLEMKLMDEKTFDQMISPDAVTRLGSQ